MEIYRSMAAPMTAARPAPESLAAPATTGGGAEGFMPPVGAGVETAGGAGGMVGLVALQVWHSTMGVCTTGLVTVQGQSVMVRVVAEVMV